MIMAVPMYLALGCSTNIAARGDANMEGKTKAIPSIEVCEDIIRNPGYETPFAERPDCIRGREDLYTGLLNLLNKEEFVVAQDGELVKVAYPIDQLHEEAVQKSGAYRVALRKADYNGNGYVESGPEAYDLLVKLTNMKPVGKKNTVGAYPVEELQYGRALRE